MVLANSDSFYVNNQKASRVRVAKRSISPILQKSDCCRSSITSKNSPPKKIIISKSSPNCDITFFPFHTPPLI